LLAEFDGSPQFSLGLLALSSTNTSPMVLAQQFGGLGSISLGLEVTPQRGLPERGGLSVRSGGNTGADLDFVRTRGIVRFRPL
jgi:hypothetical protein